MSQPKALDSENLFQSLRSHGNGNRLEPHLVAISVPARRGRKKFMSGGKKTNIFCNAKQKESGVGFHLKGAENINSTTDQGVESGFSVPVQVQDNALKFSCFY